MDTAKLSDGDVRSGDESPEVFVAVKPDRSWFLMFCWPSHPRDERQKRISAAIKVGERESLASGWHPGVLQRAGIASLLFPVAILSCITHASH